MRGTKLVCTIGPATVHRLGELVATGMDVARVNLSHGTEAEHARAVAGVREASEQTGRPVGILMDLPGPKIRLGEISGGSVEIETGATFDLRADDEPGDAIGAPVSHRGLGLDLRPGDRVFLADGAVELMVTEAGPSGVRTRVTRGGTVRSRSGVNVPSDRLSLPAVTDADRQGLAQAIRLGADFVAQSFVRGSEDVRALRALCDGVSLRLMAKIETRAAIDDAEAILREADAIMLARGDLGVEIPYEKIPAIQRRLVAQAVAAGVPVVVATQMLESMTSSPRPTRAEAADVATAVLQSADGILLSAETAIGSYPIEAARAACRIAEETEREPPLPGVATAIEDDDVEEAAVARAAAALAERNRDVRLIAGFTRTGRTAELLSAARPSVPVVAFSPDDGIVRRLTILRGVRPLGSSAPEDTDAMIAMMDRGLRDSELAEPGHVVVMVASIPAGRTRTNMLKVHHLGDPAA
ncbi:MAG: pyruvate kinase [Actinomycetota bacterium]